MSGDGFLGYPTSFMLDFVVCALVLIVPILIYSLWQAKFGRRFALHRRLQTALGLVLLIAVAAFEVDLQLVQGGWQKVMAKQKLADKDLQRKIAEVRPVLLVHLVFAVSTPLLWAGTLGLALWKFPRPTQPGVHSRLHRLLGWASAADVTLTSVTGLIFYYVAFVR